MVHRARRAGFEGDQRFRGPLLEFDPALDMGSRVRRAHGVFVERDDATNYVGTASPREGGARSVPTNKRCSGPRATLVAGPRYATPMSVRGTQIATVRRVVV